MKEVWQNKKARIGLIFGALVIVACIVFMVIKLTDRGTPVEVAKVEKNDVEQHYDTAGVMTSASSDKYYAYVGMVAKEVKVAPGDAVCKGDVLATFDTSVLNDKLSEKQKAVKEAQDAYNSAAQGKADTANQIKDIESQIANLKDQKAKLEASGESSSTSVNIPDFSNMTEAEITAFINQASSTSIEDLANTSQAIDIQIAILEARKSLSSTGSLDSILEVYKQTLDARRKEYNAVLEEKKLYEQGIVAQADGKVANVYIKEGEPYKLVEDASANMDLSSMFSGMDLSSFDIGSLLSSFTGTNSSSPDKGLAIEVSYYDGYKIGFTLGKYDLETVKVGMPATVNYIDYEYEAEVSYISAIANTSTDIVTSMMGGSSTTTSSNVDAEVTIKNPDEKLVLGFDAKVSILVGEKKNVLTIPVEALIIDEGKTYVYVIDDKKATRKEIEVGISSEQYYEVTKGLTEGDSVILNSSKINEGEKVYER
ncbi:MAG: hypothetical protein KBS82_06865 [Oscillospiraceae bacterium]|nr:hypothetical protein [Candidatus Limimonas egerieequi]